MSSFNDFFTDIKNFFHGGTVLGVDIGTTSLKAVELKKTGDVFFLENYAILETKDYLDHPNQAIQTSSLKMAPLDAASALAVLLREMKPKTKLAVATLPLFATFATTLDFPELGPNETEKAVQFQAPQYVPIPINEVTLEWRVVGGYVDKEEKRHQQILLSAVPNDIIKNFKQAFRSAGLRLVSLENEVFTIARALSGYFTDSITLVVDIGAISTGFFVVEKGIVAFVGQTDYSGVYLTQALSRSLEISMSRAEELKRRRGLVATGTESELSTILLPFLDVIIQECRRVKDSYEAQFKKTVQKIILVGGGANLSGVPKYFADQMNLMLGHHSFTSGIRCRTELGPVTKDLDNRFVSAYGSARRYFNQ